MPPDVKLLGSVDRLPSGRYRYRVTVGGKSSRDTYDTEADALGAQLAVSLAATQPKTETLGEYFPRYLEHREKVQKTRDMRTAKSLWNVHIKPTLLARMALREIRRCDVEAWAEKLSGLVQTRKHALHLLSRCLDRAKRERLIGENPAFGVRIEGKDPDVWSYLSASEQRTMMTASSIPEMDRLAIAFAIGTGLRIGEQWSLQIVDVHTGEDPHVIVRWGAKGKPTKTGKPRRVPLFPWVVAVVERALELQKSYLVSPSGKKTYRNEHGLLWPTWRGNYRRGSKPPRKWSTWLKTLSVRGVTGHPVVWHSMRHTCASMLVSGAWGRRWTLQEVAELLGHESVETTERYAHLAEGTTARAARETMGAPLAQPLVSRPCHAPSDPSRATLDSNQWPSAPEACGVALALREDASRMTPNVTSLALAVVRLAAQGDGRVVAAALRLAEAVLSEAIEDVGRETG